MFIKNIFGRSAVPPANVENEENQLWQNALASASKARERAYAVISTPRGHTKPGQIFWDDVTPMPAPEDRVGRLTKAVVELTKIVVNLNKKVNELDSKDR